MTNLTEVSQFDDGILQLETTTAALGGPDGVMNSQGKSLANRTQWLRDRLRDGGVTFAPDTGAANTYVVEYTPANTALTDGQTVAFKAKTANTGASTLSVDGLTASPIYSMAGIPLQGGEITANANVAVRWNAVLNGGNGAFSLIVADNASALPVPTATKDNHAVPMKQATSIANAIKNGLNSVTIAGAATALTAANLAGGIVVLNGALTQNGTVTLPSGTPGTYVVSNQTTGAYGITLANAGGAGGATAQVTQGTAAVIYTDGTNVYLAGSAGQSAFNRYPFTGDGATTSFSCPYTAGNILVLVNGAIVDEYTATDGVSVVFGTAPATGDQIVVIAFSSFAVANAMPKAGGTFAGPVTMAGDATGALQPVTLQQFVASLASYAPVNGSTSNKFSAAPATMLTQVPQLQQMQVTPTLTRSVASGALTVGVATGQFLTFRNAALTGGAPTNVITQAASTLTLPSGSTLGATAGTLARFAQLAILNTADGTVHTGYVNLAGGVNLDPSGLVSTTAVSASATSASVVYSDVALTSMPFLIVGYDEITQATAGTWVAPTKVINETAGAPLWRAGYGKTVQTVTRAAGTTYPNTTGRDIGVSASSSQSSSTGNTLTINGIAYQTNFGQVSGGTFQAGVGGVVPPNGTYSFSSTGAGAAEYR